MLRRVEEGRELGEPGRRVAAELIDERAATGIPCEACPRFEYRQVGFPGSVLLHRLAARDLRVASRCHPREKGVDQGRLADPGRPGHEDNPTRAPARTIEGLLETLALALAPDHV